MQMAGFLMTYKGLPSTYNKDLQEDKEPLFDAVDNVSASLKIAEGVIATLTVCRIALERVFILIFFQVHPERMRQALTMDVLATDLADYLVRKGVSTSRSHTHLASSHLIKLAQVPFRETHHISGRAVALAEARRCQISDLSFEDYKALSEKFSEDIHKVFDFEASVERRESIGGTSKKMVERQVQVLRSVLAK
jgi:argininosuccinate lyase